MSISNKERCFYFIMNHCPTFVNFFGPTGEDRPVRIRLYQEPMFLTQGDSALQGGRRYGKTFFFIWDTVHYSIKLPNREQLITALRKLHIENIFEPVVKIFNRVKFLKAYYKTGDERGSVKRGDPLHAIYLNNGHVIKTISVGDDPRAAMIKGCSPARKKVDEAQDYPEAAAKILSSTADPQFCSESWAGVVDGRRDTPFFSVLERSRQFKKNVFKFSRRYDPNFNQANLQKAIDDLGGVDADAFKQEVDAEHGNPVKSVWNINDLLACIAFYDPTIVENKRMQIITITPREYTSVNSIGELLKSMVTSQSKTILAIDPGDVQPTMIQTFCEENNMWVCKNTIELRDRVHTPDQVDIIAFIIRSFTHVCKIGIDVTNSPWMADSLEKQFPDMVGIITRVNFNKNVVYGVDVIDSVEKQEEYFKEKGVKVKIGDIKDKTMKTKPFSTERGGELMMNRQLLFYYDSEMVDDFTSEIWVGNRDSQRIDTPENVHRPEVLRCFAMAHWELGADKGESLNAGTYFMPERISTGMFGRERVPYEIMGSHRMPMRH